MNNFKKVNYIAGWLTFVGSLLVYILTLEPSVSLWDCGEFISASYKLQVVHPPGAPLFLMLGRLFSLFAGSPEGVSIAVNMMSATMSALTVMFTFWITVHFAKKLKGVDLNATGTTMAQGIAIIGAGLVAAFGLTFIDSFWFSAVEAEVYASSSAFTAFTFWAILKWETEKNRTHSNKWLILIAYAIGLSIGLHLLNLLVIPAVVYYWYFNKYPFSRKGFIISSAAAVGILGFLQAVMIPGIPWLLAKFDIMFVNGFGLPFYSGVFAAIILMVGALVFGLFISHKRHNPALNLAILCVSFAFIGYCSYTMVPIRSLADPAIDMNNPEEPNNLLSYINREQYGDRPLLRGPYFTAKATSPIDIKEGASQYRKAEDDYVEIGKKREYVWPERFYTTFPRMGDMTEKSKGYPIWINSLTETGVPTFGENLRFFFKYQINWMYMRYFFWNFVGRQNDLQNINGNIFEGNWKSGIGFIDKMRLGPQDNLPKAHQNKAGNSYYFLPLLLGILGLLAQYKSNKLDFYTVLVLFLFTGLMIIIYLNQPPLEPRERDYSHVGSFQTFCIWIGLGVIFIADKLEKYLNKGTAAIAATALCLLGGPILLGAQNWDDHDRSDRYLGIAFAKNYLNSCDSNAILFTNGDNDTYPLWYAQNVEGIRRDIRIINLSLLPTDWYSDALRHKVLDSEPLPLTSTAEQTAKGIRDYIPYMDQTLDQDKYYPLLDVVKFMLSDDESSKARRGNELTNYLPAHKFVIPVKKDKVLENGVISADKANLISEAIQFDLGTKALYKGDLILMDIIATNAAEGWKRPIYFTTTSGSSNSLNMDEYLRHEGLAFQLVPIRSPKQMRGMIDKELLYDKLMNDFVWGNMDKGEMFLDEKATLVPRNLRILFVQVADMYVKDGEKEKAVELLDKCFNVIPESILYMEARIKLFAADIYFNAGDPLKGEKLLREITEDTEESIKYYKRFKGAKKGAANGRIKEALNDLQGVIQYAKQNQKEELATEVEQKYNQFATGQ